MIDRIRRAISTISDDTSAQLEPIATSLGKAVGVADWAVELFSEEVRPLLATRQAHLGRSYGHGRLGVVGALCIKFTCLKSLNFIQTDKWSCDNYVTEVAMPDVTTPSDARLLFVLDRWCGRAQPLR